MHPAFCYSTRTMTVRKPEEFLPFGKPVLEEEEIAAVADALRTGWISTGPRTAEFQRLFAAYTGRRHALGLSSCTAGLFLALRLLDVKEGDEVVVPALTFTATANVVVHCGATPVIVDVEPETGNIDPEAIEAAVTPRTKVIVPVHLYGRPAAADRIFSFAKSRDLAVVADCAHATESRIGEDHACRWSDLAAFSFYATKNLAVGEGGMLVTDDDAWFERAAILALHGMSRGAFSRYSESGFKLYDVVEPGYKFNMTDISAALGVEQLKRIDARLARREEVWRRYDAAFASLPLDLPPPPAPGHIHARHLYTPRVRRPEMRDRLLAAIQSRGVGVGVHFTALPLHTYYRNRFGFRRGQFPNAERISGTTFSIPMTPYLTDREIERVIAAVREGLAECS